MSRLALLVLVCVGSCYPSCGTDGSDWIHEGDLGNLDARGSSLDSTADLSLKDSEAKDRSLVDALLDGILDASYEDGGFLDLSDSPVVENYPNEPPWKWGHYKHHKSKDKDEDEKEEQ